MQAQTPCEQFGSKRAAAIDSLIEAATGEPCPGRVEGRCPLAAQTVEEQRHLRVVAS